jgi:hypothetical protein
MPAETPEAPPPIINTGTDSTDVHERRERVIKIGRSFNDFMI